MWTYHLQTNLDDLNSQYAYFREGYRLASRGLVTGISSYLMMTCEGLTEHLSTSCRSSSNQLARESDSSSLGIRQFRSNLDVSKVLYTCGDLTKLLTTSLIDFSGATPILSVSTIYQETQECDVHLWDGSSVESSYSTCMVRSRRVPNERYVPSCL
jgi:hypothetical protein